MPNDKTKKEQDKPVSGELNPDELQKNLEECQKQKDEYLAGWQRERADFINHKKEEMERVGQLMEFAKEEIVLGLLPILDNLDLVEKNLPDNLKDDGYVKGMLQTKLQFTDFLKKLGVEEIKCDEEIFDPKFHEIIEEVENPPAGGKKQGTIIEAVQKGYTIGGKLLRPARVKVVK